MQEYMKRADDEVLALVTVEHPDAVARAEEIAATPGVDLAVIGSGDLATSLGHRAEGDHADVRAAIARAEAAVLTSGVPLGGVAFSPQQANDLIERGYLLVFLGFDWALLRRGAAAALDGIRREP